MQQTLIRFTMALVKAPQWVYGTFVVPQSRVPKIPVTIDMLMNRIKKLYNSLGLPVSVLVYDCNSSGFAAAKKDLKGLGGVYIWWCQQTGLFYVGSGIQFWGKRGRLNSYLQPSKIKGPNPYISKDIAADLVKYPMSSYPWKLLIVETHSTSILTRLIAIGREQIWMALLPTYNLSLLAHTNDSLTMPESDRLALPNLSKIWSYLVVNGSIVPGSEQFWGGIKYLVRTGIHHPVTGKLLKPINTSVQLSLHSGLPWVDSFLFTSTPLTLEQQASWTSPAVASKAVPEEGADGRTGVIWVYAHPLVLTDPGAAFVERVTSVTRCREQYGISRTHFKAIRRSGYPFNGKIFSNTKLH